MAPIPKLTCDTPWGRLELRALRHRDNSAWNEIRTRNAKWLKPWEATLPAGAGERIPTFWQMVGRYQAEARARRTYSWAVTLNEDLIGQLTLGAIAWGSARSASIGYWIDAKFAGRGLTPMAVALVSDYAFTGLGLHRIEIVIRPENRSSRRVVEKLGFVHEGLRSRFLHIDGEWCDHDVYSLLAENAPASLAARLAPRHEDFR